MPSPLLTFILAAAATVGATAPSLAAANTDQGAIVLIGGVLRYDNRAVWERIIELAGGAGAKFVVLTTATSRPQFYGNFAVRALQRYGAMAELLPVAPKTDGLGVDYRAVENPELLAKVKDADGVFFTAGAPQDSAAALYHTDGSATALLTAIRALYVKGGVIVGADASNTVVSTGVAAMAALQAGLPDRFIRRGLGLINSKWLVDQHFFSHGQFAVDLVAMHKLGIKYGLGAGVNAAIIITGDKQAEVFGPAGGMVIDLSQAQVDDRLKPFSLTGARLSYLGSGDSVDLETLTITPHTFKLEGFEVNPHAAGREPWFEGASFYPDVFAGSALTSLVFSAIDGSGHNGVGLAVVKDSAGQSMGFKFQFYPGADSVGWFTDRSGKDDYTVSNIVLDVTPMTKPYSLVEGHEPDR